MTDISPQHRTPRMDMVRMMLADRDSRSTSARPAAGVPRHPRAADRRRLWQDRLAAYVRNAPRA
ncbi:MAG: hypothetical protein JWN65_2514 [Solirubrobacterales bacterium]|nr:hypothetical protein [Solirubrobacterales bacterium]